MNNLNRKGAKTQRKSLLKSILYTSHIGHFLWSAVIVPEAVIVVAFKTPGVIFNPNNKTCIIGRLMKQKYNGTQGVHNSIY